MASFYKEYLYFTYQYITIFFYDLRLYEGINAESCALLT